MSLLAQEGLRFPFLFVLSLTFSRLGRLADPVDVASQTRKAGFLTQRCLADPLALASILDPEEHL